jgi:leukotriene-A4 hydrolase
MLEHGNLLIPKNSSQQQRASYLPTNGVFMIYFSYRTWYIIHLPLTRHSPSFPYGGMENPCLTFVTPTLLAGDRSLADVIAHEISHSWTGNLVTNRNWEHFWLNEGFTMFVQRRIMSRIISEDFSKFDAMIGYNALQYDIKQYQDINRTELTKLTPSMDHVDPEDAFSTVPYEK